MNTLLLSPDEALLRSKLADLVIEELPNYPEYPHQQAFTPFGLQNQLIDYIFNCLPNKSALLAQIRDKSASDGFHALPPEQLAQLKSLIGWGICNILAAYSNNYCYAEQMQMRF